jgi:hypothetical protein
MAEPADTMIAAAVADALLLQAAANNCGLVISDDVALQAVVALEALAAA